MKPEVFFSAPHDFLDLTGFEATLKIEKDEVWHRDQIDHRDAVVWVPNPGQHFVIDGTMLDRFPRLRLIATPSTGTNHIDLDACRSRNVTVLSLLDARQEMEAISASAEFSFLHVLNALRRFDIGVKEAAEGAWRSHENVLRGHELQGRTVGLVGFGRVGRRLARYLDAFGASLRIFDPYVSEIPGYVERAGDLPTLFRGSHLVVLCCTLTEETRRLVDGELMDLLPRGGILVNTARGEIVDESSICRVLEKRSDLTYSTDVLVGEVSDEHDSSCLWKLRATGQVIITPHMAGVTDESQQKAAEISLRLATSFLTSGSGGVETEVERRREFDHVSPDVEI